MNIIKNTFFFTFFFTLTIFSTLANAQDTKDSASDNETVGFGIGALIGGLIAGPPGAIIGALGGTLYGDKTAKKDESISELEDQLQKKDIELAYLENEVNRIKSEHANTLFKVRLVKRQEGIRELSEGVSISVYFRTGKTEIDPTLRRHIFDLAKLIRNTPEINVQLNAHTDRRGNPDYNMKLSRARAQAVEDVLVMSGLPGIRIFEHAYGESKAEKSEGDYEGYVFDRRVDILLTVDTEV